MPLFIALGTFIATFIGGMVALKLRDKMHLILGFSAGAVIGVAFFDLLPESLDLGSKFYDPSFLLSIVGLGFLAYLLLDRLIFLHGHGLEDHEEAAHERGIVGAGSLSLHSFLDGVAIGLAFQVSSAVGLTVAIAVLVHDFSDGINTVSLIVKNKGNRTAAFLWLLVDAAAPVLGVVSTMFFRLPEESLAVVLAIFGGFFLYIGASDLIPESHHAHPKFLTTIMTLLGAGVLYLAIRFAI